MTPAPRRLTYNDQSHRYWLDGKAATGVSTVAKGFQDSYNIDRKIKRDVAKGMARRPDLCSVVVALGDDDTWETKKKIDKIATDAIEASGAWAKANHGTAKHTILERVHKGLSLDDVFDDRLVAYAKAYEALIAGAGLTPVPHLTERFIVYPELLIAGRMDCAYLSPASGTEEIRRILLGDFKSGAKAVAYPHSIVAQLGLYLNAPFLYNEETDELDPAPLWGDTIIVAHVPDDITQFGIWEIDAGLAKQVALAALERHRYIKSDADTLVRQRYVAPTTEDEWTTSIATAATRSSTSASSSSAFAPGRDSSAIPASGNFSKSTPTTQPADPFDGLVDGYVAPAADPKRRAWIIGRLETLRTVDGALARVGQLWPSGLATLKNSDRHTDTDIDRIVAVLDAVEAEFTVTFPTKDPTIPEEIGRWTKTKSSESESNSSASRLSSEKPETDSTNGKPDISPSPPSESGTDSIESLPNSEPDQWTTTPSASTAKSSTTPTPSYDDTSQQPTPAPTPTSPTTHQRNPEPDEGPDADQGAVTALENAYKALDGRARSWIAGIARDAQQAGRPIHLQGHPTVRRFEIVRGLVTLAKSESDEDDIVRGLVHIVLFDETASMIHEVGRLVSHLHAEEATRFADLCVAFCDGRIAMTVNDDGSLRLTHSH